jgi:hypothetical protein
MIWTEEYLIKSIFGWANSEEPGKKTKKKRIYTAADKKYQHEYYLRRKEAETPEHREERLKRAREYARTRRPWSR